MFVNEVCLTLIVLGSMSFGCCVGVVVMAMCKVSACELDEQGSSAVPELRK